MFYLAVTGGRAPRIPHQSVEEAQAEALRLATLTKRRVALYALIEFIDPPVDNPAQGGENGLV